jgi:protoheme ferro-lyase
LSARAHVVLLTYGEPPEVAFLPQFTYSWRILFGLTRIIAPIPLPVLPVIAYQRARLRVKMWRDEGYSSPIEAETIVQRELVRAALQRLDPAHDWQAHVAYEFRRPLLTDLVAALPQGEPVRVVPMYLADSAFTHALARTKLAPFAAARGRDVRVADAVPAEVLAAMSAAHVEATLLERGFGAGPDTALLLAAHGTLVDPPKPIATGRVETTAVAEGIARRLAPRFGRVLWGWLNHTMGGEWTSPPADVGFRMLLEDGYKRIVYYPYGFLADNAESQLEGRIVLKAAPPGVATIHLPCLNASPALAEALAHTALDAPVNAPAVA